MFNNKVSPAVPDSTDGSASNAGPASDGDTGNRTVSGPTEIEGNALWESIHEEYPSVTNETEERVSLFPLDLVCSEEQQDLPSPCP